MSYVPTNVFGLFKSIGFISEADGFIAATSGTAVPVLLQPNIKIDVNASNKTRNLLILEFPPQMF